VSNPYDWIVKVDENATLHLLDAILAIDKRERPPEASRLLEAVVQLWHGLYGAEILFASYRGLLDPPPEHIDEVRRLIACKTKGSTAMPEEDKPTPAQPDRPVWLQHSSTPGLLDLIVSLSRSPTPAGETMLLAFEEYVTRVGLHAALFNVIEAEADASVLSSLRTVLQEIWNRYLKEHNDRTVPF